MGITFADLVDPQHLQSMAEALHRVSGIPIGIIDIDGTILVSTGWQEICTRFHRVHPECLERCHASDRFIVEQIATLPPTGHIAYKCQNGLWDLAIPILVDGRHLATCFLGQFFFEDEQPDRAFFREQAEQFGFDPDAYLAALDQVPIFSREKVDNIIAYDRQLVAMLSELGLNNLRLRARFELLEAAISQLQREIDQRVHAEAERDRFFDLSPDFFCILTPNGQLLRVNPALAQALGFSVDELLTLPFPTQIHPDDLQPTLTEMQRVLDGGASGPFTLRLLHRNGTLIWTEWTGVSDGQAIYAAGRDVTHNHLHHAAMAEEIAARKQAEANLLTARHQLQLQVACINRIQGLFISESHPDALFNTLIREILIFTNSTYGFITKITHKIKYYIKLHHLVNLHLTSSIQQTTTLSTHDKSSLCILDKNCIIAMPVFTGQPLIANHLTWQHRRCGLPIDHPALHAYLGVPIKRGDEVIGILGLANRSTGYDQTIVDALMPVVAACAQIIEGYDNRQQRLETEARLRKSEELLHSTFEATRDGILVVDGYGAVLRTNSRFRQMWRIPDDILLTGRDSDLLKHVLPQLADPERFLTKVEELYRQQEIDTDQILFKDGRIFERYSSPLSGKDGFRGRVWIFSDITERKQAEAALQENEQRLREIAATLGEGLYVVGVDWRISFINPTALHMLGWREEEVLGQSSHPLFHHSHPDGSHYPSECCLLCPVLEQGQIVHSDQDWLWHRDGHGFPVALIASPILRDGKVQGAVVVFRDITVSKRTEEELRLAKEVAEKAARVKGEFLAAMSHEIRTPMNVVLGMSELLLETALNDEQRRYTETMHHSGKALLTVINDVLDFSRIEAGRITLADLPFSPRQVVEETARLMRLAAQEKGLMLVETLADGVPERILGDDGRVRQVLLNLLGNAIKFTHQGRVDVSLSWQTDEPGTLLFRVLDTGIGIAPEQLPHIFEQFIQADAGINRRYGGTGLGLAICRRLVERMGGRIWVESEPHEGSLFCFTLPVRLASHTPPIPDATPADPLAGTSGLDILLAEDVEENRILFAAYLAASPHRLVMVHDGLAAVERVRMQPFDVIIMDIQMPGMDGYTATRQIRTWEQQNHRSPIPIIALSAHAMEGEMERSREAGCTRYLSKPIRKKALLEVLRTIAVTGCQK
ncbi:MAG: PAS domain S-box protein [Magnetococcales bacterium]|nr:PocR ligand-binding domain-containing protein [Magnetococcales bacterium]NGZ07206.1 PAS domain S-box protein [Magnetococcales bacterium]